jgi:DNA ligase-1
MSLADAIVMIRYLILLILVIHTVAFDLQLPKIYKDQNISGWVMSEKLDGIRAYWNGKYLSTKKGYRIQTPDSFIRDFPPFALDGELWIDRGEFEMVQAIVLDDNPSKEWEKVTYNIFEVPHAKGSFLKRLDRAKEWFAKHQNRHVRIVKQHRCQNREELNRYLTKIVSQGGEGVIVKDPHARYSTGRSDKILKVKKYLDAEGKVISINPGKGKFENMMGSLSIEMKNGKRFKLGSGFKKTDRINPPKIGSYVTFKYYGLTKKGIPKFASYMRVRDKKTYSFK